NTCGDCNGGWMSQIEQRAIVSATSLIQGRPCVLDSKAQKALAALFCLITIRAEFSELSTLVVPTSDRTWLKDHLEAPALWQIWINRYTGSEPESHWCRHYGLRLQSSPDDQIGSSECNTQTTTLVLGQLCVHAFSSTFFYRIQRLSRTNVQNLAA